MPTQFNEHHFDSVESGGVNINKLTMGGHLTNSEQKRITDIRTAWNFYEGYHWEGIDDEDSPQITYNYVRPFVNKFVSFEFGEGFTINTLRSIENTGVTLDDKKLQEEYDTDNDGVISSEEADHAVEKTTREFLEQVWEQNNLPELCTEMGQTKSITGDAWVKVSYTDPEDIEHDPFEEYEKGCISITVVPTQYVFPQYSQHDRKKLESVLIMYPVQTEKQTGILRRRNELVTRLYKEYWTADEVVTFIDDEEQERYANPYEIIPIIQIKNFPVAGRSYGCGDIEDLIPLNAEYNYKKSDVSEIIDYHSAPITLVFGSKVGNLEKGANKVWGGLPKDGRVENLGLNGELGAANDYLQELKSCMCEIGGVPEGSLGGTQRISNTSGVALHYNNLPLIDRVNIKRNSTEKGLTLVNKLILHIALVEGLIEKPEGISRKDFLYNEVHLPDTLPKDKLVLLQEIEWEMRLGMECRHGAMQRLGIKDPESKIREVDRERELYPDLFGLESSANSLNTNADGGVKKTNSGFLNGEGLEDE